MRIEGIEFEKEELESFQQFAPKSKGAVLLEKILQKIASEAQFSLVNVGNEEKVLRVAQGKLQAIDDLTKLANVFAELDWESLQAAMQMSEEGDEVKDMEANDVGF